MTNDTYLIGASQCDLTPEPGCFLSGLDGRIQRSTAVYNPLRGAAFWIDTEGTPFLIVTAEWLGFYQHADRLREMVSQATGIDQAAIILAGTHTHCGPCLREIDVERHGDPLDTKFINQSLLALTDTARRAKGNREPAVLTYAVGMNDMGCSRRRPNADGGVDWAPYREGAQDHQVPLLRAINAGGTVIAVLINYACHPTANGGLEIGGDYAGFTINRLEEAYPEAIVGFLQGCGGDQKPFLPTKANDGFQQATIPVVEALGRALGESALEPDEFTTITGAVSIEQGLIDLKTMPLDETLIQERLISETPSQVTWAEYYRDRLAAGEEAVREIPFEIQVVTLGSSLVIVTLAAEMSVEYGLRIKRELGEHFDAVLVVGYANAIIGYVPVKRQIPEKGYEVEWNNVAYKRPGRYVNETEEEIMAAIRSLLPSGEERHQPHASTLR